MRRSGPDARRPEADDRGSATLPALACLGVLLLLGAALGVAAAMVTAHRSAQSAADLAALAAAGALGEGMPGGSCAAAESVAAANGARMTGCQVDGRSTLVRVVVTGPHWLGQEADLEASARAGPAAG